MSGRQPETDIDPVRESPGSLLEAEGGESLEAEDWTEEVAATDWRAEDGKDPNDSRPGNKHSPGLKYFRRHRQAMEDHLERFSNELAYMDPKLQGFTGSDITKDVPAHMWPFGHCEVHSLEHILDSDREHNSGARLNLESASDYNNSEFFEKFNRTHTYENEHYTDNPQFFPKPILQSTNNVYYGHQQLAPEQLAKSICSDRSDKRNFWSGWQDLKTELGVSLKTLKDNCAKEGYALMLVALAGYFDGQPFDDFGNKVAWSYVHKHAFFSKLWVHEVP